MIRLSNRLGATLDLPPTIGWRRVPLSIGVPNVPNAHGDGSVVVGRSRMEARQFRLSGSIYYPNRQQIRSMADTVLVFLQHPPIEIYKWPDASRRLYAYPQGAAQDWLDAGAELVIDVPMLVPDPYWYGSEVTIEESATTTWSIAIDGTAPTHPIVTITLTAAGSDLSLTNASTSQVIELDGSYQSGDIVKIDTARYHAELNDEPINDQLSDEFISDGFALHPGPNTLTYDGPAADVTLTYRPRWY